MGARSCSQKVVCHARKTLVHVLSQGTTPSIVFSSISSRVILAKEEHHFSEGRSLVETVQEEIRCLPENLDRAPVSVLSF